MNKLVSSILKSGVNQRYWLPIICDCKTPLSSYWLTCMQCLVLRALLLMWVTDNIVYAVTHWTQLLLMLRTSDVNKDGVIIYMWIIRICFLRLFKRLHKFTLLYSVHGRSTVVLLSTFGRDDWADFSVLSIVATKWHHLLHATLIVGELAE